MRPDSSSEAKYWAGGFFYDPGAGRILLHKRDSNTPFNPNKWAFFGGLRESEERPEETCAREFNEELGVVVPCTELVLLNHDYHVEHQTFRYVFFVLRDVDRGRIRRGEGEACEWVRLQDAFRLDLTDKTRRDLRLFTSLARRWPAPDLSSIHR